MNYKKDKPVIRLLQSADKDFFLDCVDELYGTISQDPHYTVTREISASGRLKPWLLRKLQGISLLYKLRIRLGNKKVINFASMISGDFRIIVPAAFFSNRNYIYMYDVWPRFQHWIFPMLDVFNITHVFFSSKQVYEDYQKKCPGQRCKALWLPEALIVSDYRFIDHELRKTDVLEFGRNYEKYHDLIVDELQRQQKRHIYKTAGMPVLFEGRKAFIDALSQSRIVICAPSNITHPERAEYISSMTLRYLQAMASKCLVVGIMPSDMEELFGYVPIVEIEMNRAAEQILEILSNYDDYLPLIEKNYAVVKAKHQWQNRWEVIRQKMEAQI